MGGHEVTIHHAGHDYHAVANILAGAYALEFDVDVADQDVRSIAIELRSLLKEFVGHQRDTYAMEIEGFPLQFHVLTRRLEEAGFELQAKLKLVNPMGGVVSISTAVFTLAARDPVSTNPQQILSKVKRLSRQEVLKEMDDPEHFVFWHDITIGHVANYQRALAEATDERSIHAFLKENPVLLVQPFSSGHDRWVFPSKRLANDHEIDFMVLEKDSAGFEWTLVELEPPNEKPFLRDGKPGKRLREAIYQIETWRLWLQSNLDIARRSKLDRGHGLTDITPRTHSIILIGRESDYDESTNEWRRQKRDEGMRIHSYDWLARNAERIVQSKKLTTADIIDSFKPELYDDSFTGRIQFETALVEQQRECLARADACPLMTASQLPPFITRPPSIQERRQRDVYGDQPEALRQILALQAQRYELFEKIVATRPVLLLVDKGQHERYFQMQAASGSVFSKGELQEQIARWLDLLSRFENFNVRYSEASIPMTYTISGSRKVMIYANRMPGDSVHGVRGMKCQDSESVLSFQGIFNQAWGSVADEHKQRRSFSDWLVDLSRSL